MESHQSTKTTASSHPPIKLNERGWARNEQEKALAFGKHLEKVFQPFAATCTAEEDNATHDLSEAPFQLYLPIKKIKINEVKMIIKNNLNPKKATGYDLITGKVPKELSEKGMKMLTILFEAILRTGIFPDQWKVAQIILIPKPGKKSGRNYIISTHQSVTNHVEAIRKKCCSKN
jgi:hypothetical protein